MTNGLHQIIYFSTASIALDEKALLALLKVSQSRNQKRGITGLLLHADGSVIQIIEGPKVEVESLFDKISKDTRHKSIHLVASRTISKRDFPEYKMGFKRESLSALEEHLPGFTDIVERRNVSQASLEGLSKFTQTFIKTFARSTGIVKIGAIADVDERLYV